MIAESQSQIFCLRVLRAISLLVPAKFRADWRREWDAEVINRWRLWEKWGRLDGRSQVDLWARIRGALADALWFQQRRTRLLLVMLNMLVAVLTAYGAGQEFIFRGILNGQTQPLLLSLAGMFVSVLFMTSGIATLLQRAAARRLIVLTGILSILVHVYGAMPPHRNMGYVALLVGAGYGLGMQLVFEWNRKLTLVL